MDSRSKFIEPSALDWPWKECDKELNWLKERLAHVKRDGQRVVMLPQRESTVDLTDEPPHVPGPVQKVVFDTAGDGVHGEYDLSGTLALGPQPLFGLIAA